MSRDPQQISGLDGLREKLHRQFQSAKENKLELCFAMIELADQIRAQEAQRSITDIVTDYLFND
jgi:hypothetical protein